MPECPINKDIKAIQMVQNKLARLINGKTLKDKVSTKELLQNANLLSVNQINAKVKLQEIWKVMNIADYPLKITLNVHYLYLGKQELYSGCNLM